MGWKERISGLKQRAERTHDMKHFARVAREELDKGGTLVYRFLAPDDPSSRIAEIRGAARGQLTEEESNRRLQEQVEKLFDVMDLLESQPVGGKIQATILDKDRREVLSMAGRKIKETQMKGKPNRF